jgi:predicted AAA+ superfamily ATPase
LYSDIIHKDIIFRHNVKLSGVLKEIANSFMSNTASHVSFNKIKNVFNIKSVHTARDYISFLEESFLFFLVPRFSYKAKEREVANRKVYCIDVGMINAIRVSFSGNKGKLCENIVFLELLKRKYMEDTELYYWQDALQHEVDFVIKNKKEITELIQVCYDVSNYETKKREINALLKSSIELKCRNLRVITEDYEAEEFVNEQRIMFTPLWKWLLYI